jgi:Leucine-rich repeat (LRR) protein
VVPEVGCFLDNMRPIYPQMTADQFQFTDIYGGKIDERIRLNTNALIFRTSRISFVPKEAFLSFPKLHRVAMSGTLLKKLDVAFLSNFLRHQNYTTNLKVLDFSNNRINEIEPEIFGFLQEKQSIDLRNNTCINLKINPANDTSYKMLRLFRCFYNYLNDGPGQSSPASASTKPNSGHSIHQFEIRQFLTLLVVIILNAHVNILNKGFQEC